MSFDNKGMAEMYAAKVQADSFNKLLRGSESIPIVEVFVRFLESKPDLAKTTKLIYVGVQTAFCGLMGQTPSSDITNMHIVAYRSSLTGTSVYRNKLLRHLHAVLEWAYKMKLTRENLATAIDYFKEPKRVKEVWTIEQFRTVLTHCDPETKMLALLCLNGVGRVGSVQKLRQSQIDREAGTVTLIDEKQNAERVTPLHPMVLEALKTYTADPLFTKKFHHERWQKICILANVPFMKFHDLRTCLSTWLQDRGISSDIVASIFGHSTAELTKKHYTARTKVEIKRAAIEKLEM